MPLGATVTSEKVYSVFRRPGHEFRSGSTYGGHTLACAATLAGGFTEEELTALEAARTGAAEGCGCGCDAGKD